MDKERALETLRHHAGALRARGVQRAALFGSVARGEATSNSDIDILVELDPAARLDVFRYAGLKRYIEELFDAPVDVVSRAGLKPHLRTSVMDHAIYAF
jgi:predicted nucleotidyltransferase